MRYILFKIGFVIVLISVIVAVDYCIGFIAQTAAIKTASRMFREEASPLSLRTRILVPNIVHRYRLDESPTPEPRLFRTDDEGTIIGSKQAENADATQILFIGCSITEANEVDEPFRFPYLAGQLLSKETGRDFVGINLGVRGNTSRDSINLLINHPSVHDAEYIALMQNINDRLVLAFSHSYDVKLENLGEINWKSVTDSASYFFSDLLDYVSYRSNIVFLLRNKLGRQNPWTGEESNDVEDDCTYDYKDSNIERSKKQYEQSLKLFVSITRTLNKDPILITQPLGCHSEGQSAFNDVIRTVAEDTSTALIDLDNMISSERKWFFLSDGIHLNNEGSKLFAELISARLKSIIHGIKGNTIKAMGLGATIFSNCLSPSDDISEIRPGSRHLLLRVSGRYPVFSSDEKYLFFQSTRDDREVIEIYDLVKDQIRTLSPENARTHDRHAVSTSIDDNNSLKVFFGRDIGNGERIYSMNLGSDKANPVLKDKGVIGSIPAVYANQYVFFAGSRTNEKGRPTEAPNLYRFDLKTRDLLRLTDTDWEEWRPAVSHKGDFIYHIANPDGQFDIFRLDVQSGETKKIFGTPSDEWDPDISPSGNWMVFASKKSGNWDLYLMDLRNMERVVQLTSEKSDDWDPRFMPISNAIVFAASENEQPPNMYYLCPFGEIDK